MKYSFVLAGLLAVASSENAPLQAPNSALDELWLRHVPLKSPTMLTKYQQLIQAVKVSGTSAVLQTEGEFARLETCAGELASSLSSLLSRKIESECCGTSDSDYNLNSNSNSNSKNSLHVNVGEPFSVSSTGRDLGAEGFEIKNAQGEVSISAKSADGALYGAFRLLSYLQQNLDIPPTLESSPSLELRVWDLWDTLSGDVTRGYR